MAMTEDLSAFFNTSDFAISATYYAGGTGGGVAKSVIFDRGYAEQLGVSSSNPVALGMAADFTGWLNTDTLVIGAVTYRITDSRPVDDGATVVLELELQ